MEVVRETPLLRWLRVVKRSVKLGLLLFVLAICALFLMILYLRSQPLPAASINQTSTVYASNGEVLDTIHRGENRIVVPLKDISPYLVQATLAIEDRYFYNHYGFDIKRTAMAAYINIRDMDKSQGASTISQQLARNLYLTHEKTWSRKIKEALITVQLELNYSKDEILEMYMNQIYYGESAYGAEAAAQTYFGKSAKDLTLSEATMLAGIPKGPTYYSPFNHYENSRNRQKLILDAMERDGYITAEQSEAAYAETLAFKKKEQNKKTSPGPYFNDYLATLVIEHYGIAEELYLHGGLKIYTTLDYDMQQKAEEVIDKYLGKSNPELQTALVAIEPQTGQIKAMVGGRDYTKSQYNRVFSKRQPGSSFKPLLYLAALENGFTPITMMKSEPTIFTYDGGKQYIPSNFGDRYANDYITLQRAIATSDNIYAVKTIDQLTPGKLVEEAKKLGITSKMQAVPSLALGTSPVSPYELTAAYAAIANKGEMVKPIAITKIVDSEGNILVEEKSEKQQVADPQASFLLTHMMQSVFEPNGTAYRVAHQLNRPVAGKTGTTDYDAWLSGFTPQLATTVWVGYDEGKKVDPIKDARLAAPIWADFMESALKDQPPTLFDVPQGIISVYINPENGKLATEHCPAPQLLYFAAGTEPTDFCTEHLPNPSDKPQPLKPTENQSFWQRMGGWWSSP
ncbi:transglycosylase domain-containing protein [Brevibacillus dissolubilis]|uniref:transglycosylase domain-containing protein n=1 Tax=Brevibacillus dissolubilis TaxID=1844116 RepID=UPI0011170C64|nr:PBP1A family penicillin-binding protein [Brevibacillus dissolubilis]